MKFQPGQIVSTAGIHKRMTECEEFAAFITESITRHLNGDWSDATPPEDREANDYALNNEERILSAYINEPLRVKVWIISEADRSITTILFPEEY